MLLKDTKLFIDNCVCVCMFQSEAAAVMVDGRQLLHLSGIGNIHSLLTDRCSSVFVFQPL